MHRNSKHFITPVILSVLTIMIFVLDIGRAEAIPAFARQTGQPCTSCHSQHFPTLNSFGRMFKASGYTLVGSQEQVVGSGLELPAVINAALVANMQYINGEGEEEFGYPAAFSLYLAGKMGAKSGFLVEIPFADGAQLANMKWNYVTNKSDINVGAHAFGTSMAGPAYGYELLSTGAMGMNVALTGQNAMGAIGLHMEHGTTMMSQFMSAEVVAQAFEDDGMSAAVAANMAANMSMNMAGAATGAGVSAQTNDWFVYYAPWYGAQQVEHVANPSFAHYLRAAWTPIIGGWDLGMGVQIYRGNYSYEVNGAVTSMDAVATTFDFQGQGEVGGMPVGVYLSYAQAPESDSMTQMNSFNMAMDESNNSYAFLVEAEVVEHLSAQLGYVSANYGGMTAMEMAEGMDMNGDGDMMDSFTSRVKGTSITVGVDYLLAPNKRLGARLVSFGGDLDANAGEIDLTIGF